MQLRVLSISANVHTGQVAKIVTPHVFEQGQHLQHRDIALVQGSDRATPRALTPIATQSQLMNRGQCLDRAAP